MWYAAADAQALGGEPWEGWVGHVMEQLVNDIVPAAEEGGGRRT
jgi:hypothetical protein